MSGKRKIFGEMLDNANQTEQGDSVGSSWDSGPMFGLGEPVNEM